MVISNTNFAKFFFLLVLVVSINACKKDTVAETKPNVTVPPSPLLKADKQSVNPLEIVSLSSQNISFTQSSYSCSIGGYAVKLVSYENKLGFQMPDLPAGNYTLETSIEGSSFSISLNVLALANIADPETYIQTARNKFEYSSSYLNTLANGMNNMNGSENNTANINILNN